MKESLYNRQAMFRETFNSYSDTLKNGGVFRSNAEIVDGVLLGKDNNGGLYSPKLPRDLNKPYTFRVIARKNINGYSLSFVGTRTSRSGGAIEKGYLIELNPSGRFRMMTDDGVVVTQYNSSIAITDFEWHEYVVCIDYNNNIYKTYIDGVLVRSVAIGNSGDITSVNNPYIGSVNTLRNADIALVEVYDGLFSAEEVSTMYKNTLYIPPAKEVVGEERIANGSFEDSSSWITGNNSYISDGTAHLDGATHNSNISQTVDNPSANGERFVLNYEVKSNTCSSGLKFYVGGYTGHAFVNIQRIDSSVGKHQTIISNIDRIGDNNRIFFFIQGGVSGELVLDNISVEKVTGEILNINANRGAIVDEHGADLTNTGVEVIKDECNVIKFEGTASSSNLQVSNVSTIAGNNYTFSMWIKKFSNGEAGFGRLFDLYSSFMVYNRSNNNITILAGGSSAEITLGLSNQTYYKLDFIYHSDGTVKTFLNGVLHYTSNLGAVATVTDDLCIGTNKALSRGFDGFINDFVIQDRLLSAEEIARNFNSQRGKYNV